MDFAWDAELLALAEEAHEVGHKAALGRPVKEDSWIASYDRDFSRELGQRGWLGMTWPVAEGGHGRSALERMVVFEALITEGAPVGMTWMADRQIGPTLLSFGTPEQRRRYLPEIVAGEVCWCIGMSEPDAGSDLAGLRTTAVRDGDSFVVNGTKLWTSFAARADYCYLIARTNAEVPPHRGLSELIVDLHSPGIDIQPIRDMTGEGHFCQVWFDNVRVPADNLVGQLDGSWRQVMRQLEHERGGIDRLVSNRALFLDALAVADRQDARVRQEIAAIEARFRVGRLLVIREIIGQAPPSFSAATKMACTALEQDVANFVARVGGPGALLWGRSARAVCYAPAYTIQGGTSTILHNIVAERTLGLPR